MVGEKPSFFPFKNHVELGSTLKLLILKDLQKLLEVDGALYRLGARLEWALLNLHAGYSAGEWVQDDDALFLVKPEIMFGSGQLPKFENQLFKLTDEHYQLYMIPTAEAALNGFHYDEILKEEELPLKTRHTPCFRREAGAAGSQERG
jgi:seryl-tRNA synthetase